MAQETLTRLAATPDAAVPDAAAPPRKMSFEEFLEWADEDTRAEWVDGEVVPYMSASDPHQDVANFLVAIVRAWVEAQGAGWVRSNPFLMRLVSRPSGREPDLVYVREENKSRLRRTYIDGPADLAVEIISPESEERDRVDKLAEYEAGGVREYWLLDQEKEEARFYQLNQSGKYQLASPDENGVYHSAVIDGLWLREAWLWQPPKLMDVLREWKLI